MLVSTGAGCVSIRAQREVADLPEDWPLATLYRDWSAH